MEYNLSSLKTATEKIYHSVKNGIGLVKKTKQAIATKIDELESYQKQQTTLDSEIEGQLNIMYKINMQLQAKKEEITFTFEKYDANHDRLEAALVLLKSKRIDDSLIHETIASENTNKCKNNDGENVKLSGTGEIINSGSTASNEDENKRSKDSAEESKSTPETDDSCNATNSEKLETLYDFVDIETINMYKGSFKEHLKNLSTIRNALEPMISKLLGSINQRIFEVKKYQDKLVFEYEAIKLKHN
jgi:hypothetical protein